MVVFPNCKINLGLNIIRKRADNYHDLETVFYPLSITDALEVITSEKQDEENVIQFNSTGLQIDGTTENNLCIKAYHILKKDYPNLPSIKMHLHKAIPMGAGLGGGSADGAFTLKLLNNKFNLGLSKEQLINYSLRLGSDCPFFIMNKPCFATSRGEILEEIKIDLSDYKFVIVNPGIHINTGWAFSKIKPAQPQQSIKEIIQLPVEQWKDLLENDFEEAVVSNYPDLKMMKDNLYNAGAVYASMSGSGSTFYGIFRKEDAVQLNQFSLNYYVRIVE